MVTKQGTTGDDTLVGTKFKDKLFGLEGSDTLKGLQGNDRLSGGEDSVTDTFVFGKNSGKDIVTDFDVKHDVLQIAKGLNGIKKAADVLKHADQKGKDVVIDLGGGNKITLKGVDLSDLKKNPGDHFDIG